MQDWILEGLLGNCLESLPGLITGLFTSILLHTPWDTPKTSFESGGQVPPFPPVQQTRGYVGRRGYFGWGESKSAISHCKLCIGTLYMSHNHCTNRFYVTYYLSHPYLYKYPSTHQYMWYHHLHCMPHSQSTRAQPIDYWIYVYFFKPRFNTNNSPCITLQTLIISL